MSQKSDTLEKLIGAAIVATLIVVMVAQVFYRPPVIPEPLYPVEYNSLEEYVVAKAREEVAQIDLGATKPAGHYLIPYRGCHPVLRET